MYSVFQGWFGDNKYAGFQQYALIDAELAAKVRIRSDTAPSRFFRLDVRSPRIHTLQIPDNISFDQAASVPVALVAVILPNFNHNPSAKTANFTAPWEEGGQARYAGKPAFIVGGSSSVGQYGASPPSLPHPQP